MDYYKDGQRIARMADGDPFTAQIFVWDSREWRTDDNVGAEIVCSGNFLPISEVEAQRVTRATPPD